MLKHCFYRFLGGGLGTPLNLTDEVQVLMFVNQVLGLDLFFYVVSDLRFFVANIVLYLVDM